MSGSCATDLELTGGKVDLVVEVVEKSPKSVDHDYKSIMDFLPGKIEEHYCKFNSKSWLRSYGGLLMALSSSLFFSLSFITIKILQKGGYPAIGSAVVFNTGVAIPCILLILIFEFGPGNEKRKRIFAEVLPLNVPTKKTTFIILLVQGLLQGSSVVFRTYSLHFISIGDMTVIVFSSPVVTTIFAHFLVGEKIGYIFILIALVTLVGVGLIMKPPFLTGEVEFDVNHLVGVGLAAGALICISMKFAITRKIQHVPVLLMTLFLAGCGLLISLPLFLIFEEHDSIIPKDLTQTLLVISLLTAFCAITSINCALKMENAGPVALVRSCDVIFAFLFQFIFLGMVPDSWSSIGAALVILGVLMSAYRKWLAERADLGIKSKMWNWCLS